MQLCPAFLRVLDPVCWIAGAVWLFVPSAAPAQHCGCADSGICPQSVAPGQTVQICYDITDALNDDLADPAQGICGVSLAFTHGNVEELSITLLSPAGQTVNLVGAPCDGPTITTIFSTWQVDFVPCAATAIPDTIAGIPIASPWDGCNDNNVWPIGNYSGSYHPHAGCLEDFDTGPVNGTWCLLVQNTSAVYSASILDFSLTLCDDTGIFCCEADAGQLTTTSLVFCASDTTGLQHPDIGPQWTTTPPDSATYGYLWLAARQDTIAALLPQPDFSALDTGRWTVCGLSYLLADSAALPQPGTALLSSLSANLASDSAAFCGDLTPACLDLRIVPPPDTTHIDTSLCTGDTLMLGDSIWFASGQYSAVLPSWAGCDSIVQVALTVHPADTTWLDTLLCAGDTLRLADSAWWQAGIYQLTGTNQFGCDSTTIVLLDFRDSIQTWVADTICAGDTLFMGGQAFTQSGQYLVALTAASGCDSLVWIELTVWSPQAVALPPDTLSCARPVIALDGANSSGQTVFWTSTDGHFASAPDSAVVLVDAGGTYVLHAREGFCESTDTLIVMADTVAPFVDAGPDTARTCFYPQLSLSANASAQGQPFSATWTGPAVAPDSSLTVTIGAAGTYVLHVTNLTNGCTAADTLVVANDTVAPLLALPDTAWLTCTDTALALTGTPAPEPAWHFQWFGPDGLPVPASDTGTWTVALPGTWRLTAIDSTNGCQASDSTLVRIDTLPPTALIAPPDTITCTREVVALDGSLSQNAVHFLWTGPAGALPDSAVVAAAQPGTYVLTAVADNGCTDTDTVQVAADTVAPVADAGPDRTLTCGFPTDTLGGAATSTGPGLSYQWHTLDGHFLGPNDQPQVAVDSGGLYWLVVTDTTNGCTEADTALVTALFDAPLADAGPDLFLDCQTPVVWLDAGASDTGQYIGYAWYTLEGAFLTNNPQLSVNYPDTFVLTVQHTVTFCESKDTVVVTRTASAPLAEAGPPQSVNCQTGLATLDASASDSGPHIVYEWTALDGTVLAGAQTANPLVSGPGAYLLSLHDTLDDCLALDTAFVVLDTLACTPLADAGPDRHITCANEPGPLDTLDATASTQGPAMSYHWTALGGMLLDTTDALHPLVTAGLFVLEARNDLWGLSAFDTVAVTIDTVRPMADAGPAVVSVTCPQLEACVSLGGTATSIGPRFVYQWEAVGTGSFCGSTDQPTAEVDATGLYNLIVRDTVNHCQSEDAVVVQYDGLLPIANAGPDIQIPCGDTVAWLDGTGSLQDSSFVFHWFSLSGNVTSTADLQTAWGQPLNAADTFYLEVLSQQNLCRDTDAVVVFAPVNCYPDCQIAPAGPLTCAQDTLWLDGTASDTGPEFAYQWTALTGQLCGGDTTLTPCIDAPGIYQLEVTNTQTGFQSTCQVEVLDGRSYPTVDAGPPVAITCATPQPALEGSYSPQVPAAVLWHTTDGQLAGPATSLQSAAGAPGWYFLTVTRADNGCSATDSVFVGLDTLRPVAEAGPEGQLTCAASTAVLAATATPANVSWYWTSPDGEICAGATTPNPVACAPGTYILTVAGANGCTDSDTTFVTQDANALSCDAGPDYTFTCLDSTFTLQGQVQGGAFVVYQWSSPDGGLILSGDQTLTPTVGSPGTYVLEAEDLVNGCSCQSVALVHADTMSPLAVLPDTVLITCDTLTPWLDASASQGAHALAFAWSGPGPFNPDASAPAVQVQQAGTYNLSLTDTGNGCTTTDSVVVVQATALPPADAGPDTTLTCARDSVMLAAATAPHLAYAWTTTDGLISGESQQAQVTATAAGTYVLAVTDTLTGCTLTDTVVVRLDTAAPEAVILTPDGLVRTCYSPALRLDGSASQPADSLIYTWWSGSLSANGAQWQTTQAGPHLLVVQHTRNGCTDTAVVTIEENLSPPAFALQALDTLTCLQTQARLAVTGLSPDTTYLIQWTSVPPGQPIADADSAVATVFAPALYELSVTNAVTGCSAGDTILPPFDLAPPLVEITTIGELACDDPQMLLLAKVVPAESAVITWTDSEGQVLGHLPTLTVRQAGWYHLTGLNTDNGCLDADSVFVGWASPPIDTIRWHLEAPPCDTTGWQAVLIVDEVTGGTGPFVFSLDGQPAVPTPLFEGLTPGAHELVVEDVNGCTYASSLNIQAPQPLGLAIVGPSEVLLGDSVELSVQTTVSPELISDLIWLPPVDSACSSPCFSLRLSPNATLELQVTAVDHNGCTATARHHLLVRKDGPVFAPTGFSPDGDGYNDRFTLYAGPQVARIALFEIYDRWGTLLFRATDLLPNDPLLGWDGTFRRQPVPAGVYVWRAELVLRDGSREHLRGDVTLVR